MGCDIHLFIEMKYNDKWLLYNHPDIDRNYALFEKMAGVRGDIENAISPPKGFPDDASESTRICYEHDGSDAHHPSYLTLSEIAILEKWFIDQSKDKGLAFNYEFGFFFGNGFDDFQTLSKQPPITDVRFVFWFDN